MKCSIQNHLQAGTIFLSYINISERIAAVPGLEKNREKAEVDAIDIYNKTTSAQCKRNINRPHFTNIPKK